MIPEVFGMIFDGKMGKLVKDDVGKDSFRKENNLPVKV